MWNRNTLKHAWLILSGFGIMFAVLSWGQESELLSFIQEEKGVYALITGLILYKIVARNMEE